MVVEISKFWLKNGTQTYVVLSRTYRLYKLCLNDLGMSHNHHT